MTAREPDVATYQSILAYDGTAFAGFQRQQGRRTVQGEVEAALRRLGWCERTLRGAGRTDSGVHASGQVVAYDLAWRGEPQRLTQALNALLPADLAVVETAPAPAGFRPRYAARWRRYRYRIVAAPQRQPLAERFAWRVWPAPEPALMRLAARHLLGEHDFGAFGTAPRRGSHTRRTVRRAEWAEEGAEASFLIEADAFLYRMVRRLAAALVAVGQAREPAETIAEHLEQPKRKWQGSPAPAHGLCLEAVIFEEERADR
jgi:tRNA pseudouridine38-40 synthase